MREKADRQTRRQGNGGDAPKKPYPIPQAAGILSRSPPRNVDRRGRHVSADGCRSGNVTGAKGT